MVTAARSQSSCCMSQLYANALFRFVHSMWCGNEWHISSNSRSPCIHEWELLLIAKCQATIRPSVDKQHKRMDHVRLGVCLLALPQCRCHRRLLIPPTCRQWIRRCLPAGPGKSSGTNWSPPLLHL